jgi:hypothetical protein
VTPLARTAGTTAKRGLHITRKWAAPRLERTGQAVQDTVAPKVSAALKSAARKVDPQKPRHRLRWIAVVSSALGAAGAAFGAILGSRKLNGSRPADDLAEQARHAKGETDVESDDGDQDSTAE